MMMIMIMCMMMIKIKISTQRQDPLPRDTLGMRLKLQICRYVPIPKIYIIFQKPIFDQGNIKYGGINFRKNSLNCMICNS